MTTDIILNRVPQQFLVFISVPRDYVQPVCRIPHGNSVVLLHVGGEGVGTRSVVATATNNPALVKMPKGGLTLCIAWGNGCVNFKVHYG